MRPLQLAIAGRVYRARTHARLADRIHPQERSRVIAAGHSSGQGVRWPLRTEVRG